MSAKILIVDDELNMIRILGYALHSAGYEVIPAKGGLEALQKVQATSPDLMILDVMMPDMDGFKVCERLREHPDTVDLPVIMLSARVQVADKILGLRAGADEYLTKPIDPNEIVARVGALLERSQRLRAARPVLSGKKFAFLGAKGGVGATTLVLNVAAAMAQKAHKVLAAEIRPSYGTFAPQLGISLSGDNSKTLDLETALITERELKDLLVRLPFGLNVLLGPQKMNGYHQLEAHQAGAIVAALSGLGAFILLDLPGVPSDANRVIVQRCDFVVLVLEREPTCLAAARFVLDMLAAWGVGGPGLGAVVVNRVALPVPLDMDEVRSQLGCEIIGVVPPAPEAIAASHIKGEPLVVCQPENVAALAMTKIAQSLMEYM